MKLKQESIVIRIMLLRSTLEAMAADTKHPLPPEQAQRLAAALALLRG